VSTNPRQVRRGFALAAVLLLSLVVAVVAAVMLQRESTNILLYHRQFGSYRTHHLGRGLREVVGQWAISLSGQPIEKMIAPDGRVLDLEMEDGTLVRVYLADGQGSALTDVSRLAGDDRRDAEAILAALDEISRGRVDPAWVRTVGPARISAASAPEEVIEAVARVLTTTTAQAKTLARAILDAREDGDLNDEKLATAASRGTLNAEELARFNRLLAPKADLWLLRADVHPAGPRGGTLARPEARYEGRIAFGQAAFGAASGLESLGAFLTWDEVPMPPAAPIR
jgi:type II secretory pathway component PulK